jgi:hypothetical protein
MCGTRTVTSSESAEGWRTRNSQTAGRPQALSRFRRVREGAETTGFETEEQKREIQRWSRLAIQFNGVADSGKFDHITTAVMLREIQEGDVCAFLTRELPANVWEISKLTDVDRHKLSRHWQMLAIAYEPAQFHVSHNGLALLVAYVLHLVDIFHATIPT